MTLHNVEVHHFTDEELPSLRIVFNHIDENHDGTLSFDEFLLYLDACNQTESDPRYLFRLIFQAVDDDHNGELSIDELHEFVTICGQPMSKQEIATELKKIDIDLNGEVSFDELCSAFGI